MQAQESDQWTWDAGVTTGLTFTDNLYADAEDRRGDLIFSLAPSFEVGLDHNGAELTLFGAAEIGRHAENSDEDYVDGTVGLKGEADLGGVTLFGGVDHEWTHESRASPEDAFGREPLEFTRLGGFAGAEFDLSGWTLRIGALADRFDFDDAVAADGSVIDADFRDRVQAALGLRATMPLENDRRVFVEGAVEMRDYDEAV